MSAHEIYQTLGLAARARKITTGEELVIKEVRNGNAKLVLLSEDASKNTSKKLHDKCKSYKVDLRVFGTRSEIGHAIGKDERVTVAVTDSGFAKKFIRLFDEFNKG
ncbi:YlxQ family RNA-binding protein [Planococcus lenghuensis]|uniref:50S ribosomal protein L7 n=1 Tax=Planococcus lenghuensis TaxID=2213202 RepID=A0A1Q2KZU7_9BACL|nr:YlxQ family RNA-binding protein [Planococcus lenghuensis]AQQ53718.1 50S ribosomal protein L7 [Planococcus lenghuensis]